MTTKYTPEMLRHWADLLLAMAEGKTIQYMAHSEVGPLWGNKEQGDKCMVGFFANVSYRVKPEPEVIYAVCNESGAIEGCFNTELSAKEWCAARVSGGSYKKFIATE